MVPVKARPSTGCWLAGFVCLPALSGAASAASFFSQFVMARRLGMHGGFDVAKGPEETIFCLQFGSAWH